MKSLIVISLLIIPLYGFSQLLRRDIYNFEIGDRYCISHNWFEGWDITVTRYDLFTITSRTYNADSSYVSYTASRNSLLPALGPGQVPQFESGVAAFSHGNLLSPYMYTDGGQIFGLSNPPFMVGESDSCLVNFFDTTVYECGMLLLQRLEFGVTPLEFGDTLIEFPSCPIEPYISNQYVQEGCGGPYGGAFNPGDPTATSSNKTLNYFRKGTTECGWLPYLLTADIPEVDAIAVTVYPSPAVETLNVAVAPGVYRYRVISMNGQEALNGVFQSDGKAQIKTTGLEAGMYLLVMANQNGLDMQIKFTVAK